MRRGRWVSAAVVVLGLGLVLAVGIALMRSRGGGDTPSGPGGNASASGGAAAQVLTPPGQPRPPSWFGQPGVAPRAIAGRVVGPDGKPLAGATVRLTSLLVAVELQPEEVRTTGGDGAFDFGPRVASEYGISALAPGKTGVSLELDLRDPHARPDPSAIELVLGDCRAALSGTVRDASGGTIARARLTQHSRQGGVWSESGDDGAYEICVPLGDLWLEVGADGYGTIFLSTTVLGRVVRDVSLTPESAITGRVILADGGAPVAGALVTASPTEWSEVVGATRVAMTDADGKFRLGRVAAGRYALEADGDGATLASQVEVAVGAGETAGDVVLELIPTVTVHGRVIRDDDETPVAGAHVGLELVGRPVRLPDAVSQADGTFTIAGVPTGLVRLDAAPWDLVAPDALQLTPPSAAVTLRVAPTASIRGRVVAHGKPVAGARVYTTTGNARAFDQTAPDGTFLLEGLQAGQVQLSADSSIAGAFAPPVSITLAPAEQKTDVTLDLSLAGSIAGTVVDQHGRAVAGAFLRFSLIGGRDFGEATTSPDGGFLAGQLSGGGRYRVQISASPRAESELVGPGGARPAPIAVRDGTDRVTGVRFVVKLDRLTIAGRVVDTKGAGVPDVRVRAAAQQAGEGTFLNLWADLPSATTDADGRFEVAELAEGTYTIDARSGAGGQARQQGVVAGARDLTIRLDPPGEIRGTLVGFPSGATSVSAMPLERELLPLRGAITGSSFRITGLAPGSYVVNAIADGLAARGKVTVEPRGVATIELSAGGSGTIRGRLRRFPDEVAQSGAVCGATTQPEEDLPVTSDPGAGGAITGKDGKFTLRAPAGKSVLTCTAIGPSGGVLVDPADVVVPDGGEVAIELWAIPIAPGPQGRLGLTLDDGWSVLVADASPAARAGVRSGDELVAVAGHAVTDVDPIIVEIYLASRPSGTPVDLELVRDGGERIHVSPAPELWREQDGLEILGDPDD